MKSGGMTQREIRTKLTDDQQRRVRQAREVLSQEHGSDVASLAARIGRLEWWLGDILALVGQIAGEQP